MITSIVQTKCRCELHILFAFVLHWLWLSHVNEARGPLLWSAGDQTRPGRRHVHRGRDQQVGVLRDGRPSLVPVHPSGNPGSPTTHTRIHKMSGCPPVLVFKLRNMCMFWSFGVIWCIGFGNLLQLQTTFWVSDKLPSCLLPLCYSLRYDTFINQSICFLPVCVCMRLLALSDGVWRDHCNPADPVTGLVPAARRPHAEPPHQHHLPRLRYLHLAASHLRHQVREEGNRGATKHFGTYRGC